MNRKEGTISGEIVRETEEEKVAIVVGVLLMGVYMCVCCFSMLLFGGELKQLMGGSWGGT